MKDTRHSEEQIIAILKQGEAGFQRLRFSGYVSLQNRGLKPWRADASGVGFISAAVYV